MMIALLGSTGYVGSVFRAFLEDERLEWVPIPRASLNSVSGLKEALRIANATQVINCAGFTGKPNVDACESKKSECYHANVILPQIIRAACEELELPFGHVSSGCIYFGDKDFSEDDEPNFTFKYNNCSYYSGTKALGEEMLRGASQCYIWRLRIPFDNTASPRNYLQKLITYNKLVNVRNSLSYVNEFITACVDCFRLNVPYGIYNLTNPGSVTTADITNLMIKYGIINYADFFDNVDEFSKITIAPRSHCTLNSDKALLCGLRLTPTINAIEKCLSEWQQN